MASSNSGSKRVKHRGSTNWLSAWNQFVNTLHKTPLVVSCPSCTADIKLTRDDVDEHGIRIYCEECHDHFVHRSPQQFVRDLHEAGVPIGDDPVPDSVRDEQITASGGESA